MSTFCDIMALQPAIAFCQFQTAESLRNFLFHEENITNCSMTRSCTTALSKLTLTIESASVNTYGYKHLSNALSLLVRLLTLLLSLAFYLSTQNTKKANFGVKTFYFLRMINILCVLMYHTLLNRGHARTKQNSILRSAVLRYLYKDP